jgi:hypothetical protein
MLDEDGMVLMSTSQLRTKRVHYESLDRYIKFRKHAEMRYIPVVAIARPDSSRFKSSIPQTDVNAHQKKKKKKKKAR